MSKIGESVETESRLVVVLNWTTGKKYKVTGIRYGVFLWGDIVKIDYFIDCTTLNILKTIEPISSEIQFPGT
jgi:hypothetical protein